MSIVCTSRLELVGRCIAHQKQSSDGKADVVVATTAK